MIFLSNRKKRERLTAFDCQKEEKEMPLRSLRYFLVAAEEMNFRKAAERLYITQQSLSSSIQKLERQ